MPTSYITVVHLSKLRTCCPLGVLVEGNCMNPRLMKLDVCTSIHTYIHISYTHNIIGTHNTCTHDIHKTYNTEIKIHYVHIDTKNTHAYIYTAYTHREKYRHTYYTCRYIRMQSPRIRGSCYTHWDCCLMKLDLVDGGSKELREN